MSRITRFAMPALAVAALALPPAQAQAVNTLAFSWVVDCANPAGGSTGSLGVTLASGTYAVTVAGACAFATNSTHSVPVSTCVHPLEGLPCVSTGGSVNNVPGATCSVGVSGNYVQTCSPVGLWSVGCGGPGSVVVNEQCLSAQNQAGLIWHGGGAMTARVVDYPHYDNVGTFVVTAVWTPL